MIDVIGYDLDGVIISDIKWNRYTALSKLHDTRSSIYPIFKPTGDFVIITGRPEVDRKNTTDWLNEHKITPIKLHMSNFDKVDWSHEEIAEYKANTINNYSNMKFFIESNLDEVRIISTKVKIPIYHFETFLRDSISGKIKL